MRSVLRNKAARILLAVMLMLLVYSAFSGYNIYIKETAVRLHYQQEVREHWENMPDKHPHRMAHYGYIVFRPKQPLSMFDFGIESYTGNAIFLEAHRQNTANFSAAGFNTGLLRFGEISMAMVLQVLLPLVLFFLGFSAVAADRENGTLKLILTQGASRPELLLGKIAGLALTGWSVLLFAILCLTTMLFLTGDFWSALPELCLLVLCYALYLAIICAVAILVSAESRQAKSALVAVLGIWLAFVVVMPRLSQAAGSYLYPSETKIALETAVEAELIRQGDSHDPNDAHYKRLKDSVLKANNAKDVSELPFNYSGLQMKEGERISAKIYDAAMHNLRRRYGQQNSLSAAASLVNPFAAVRSISMVLSGTDFNTYESFQKQAESYRYQLAQHMNDLQIKLIANKRPADTAYAPSISKSYWRSFPDFHFSESNGKGYVSHAVLPVISLLIWGFVLLFLLPATGKKIKML